ncbi:MAG TPA: CHC2 zinc finger domain-containing protein, partial [Kiritimatiellia bacterium]|nr:CHC2 zinc finger domain-containing protein [Kiritimatiellia bacterium]HRU70198.1 CHC2 zinc finger domain-containing protein [Kiritimatiellia bacterium]
MRIEDVLARLKKVRPNGERSWMACCPAHDDRNPSLSVSEGDDGRVLFNCFAGCAAEDVAAVLGLKMADLMGDDRTRRSGPHDKTGGKKERKPFSLAGLKRGDTWRMRGREWEFIERYDYHTADGAILFTKLRFRDLEGPGKTFIQLTPAPDGSPRWLFGRASNGVDEVLYHLPEVVRAAREGGEIWIAEGEKDVDELRKLGLTATCNADGAGKWRGELADALKGCARVTIIADNDPDEVEAKKRTAGTKEWWQGQRHATDIADSLEVRGIPWRALILPEIEGFHCKDASDWLAVAAKGETTEANAAELRTLIEAAADAAAPWPRDIFRRPSREVPPAPARRRGGKRSLPYPTPNTGDVEDVGCAGDAEDPASVAFLRGLLIAIMIDKDISGMQKKRSMCGEVCAWLGRRGRFYYDLHDRGHGTAMWFDAREKRLHRVSQDYFRSWLSRATAFSREFRDYRMFISAVEDEALIGEATTGITPRRYWHREGDAIYLSCGEGRMAKVTAESVGMVDNGTDGVVFEQGYALDRWKLVPEEDAQDPFAACRVFSDISTVDGRGLMLVRLWLAGMFGVTGWKPLLVLSGDVGSGKTRVAVAMFQLLGIPSRVTGIDGLGNIKDFWTSIDKGGLFCLDNADHHIPWLPDALSVISTGGTFEKKKLYTDMETVTQEARCWAVITSANPSFASDAGLGDRLITVNLQRVERDTAESVLTREIEERRDAGLSWLCHVMRRALADQEPVPKRMNRRHPDWAEWVYRLGRAAGMAAEAERAIRENESYKALFAVSNDALGRFLLQGLRGGFRGSAAELAQHLQETCEGFSQYCPKDSRAMWHNSLIMA